MHLATIFIPNRGYTGEVTRKSRWLAEIIYFPMETEKLKYARSIGYKIISVVAWSYTRPTLRPDGNGNIEICQVQRL